MNGLLERKAPVFLILGALTLAVAACGGGGAPIPEAADMPVIVDTLSVIAEGRLVPVESVQLSFRNGGEIAEVLVEEGDTVEAGQLLARLGNGQQTEAAVASALLEMVSAHQALDKLYEDAPLILAQAQLELANARDALRDAERKWQYQQEGQRGSSTTVRAAKAELALAKDAMERAERDANKFSSDDSEHAQDYKNYAAAVQRYRLALSSLNWYTGHPTDLQQAMLDAEVGLAEAQLQWSEWRWEMLTDGPDPLELALAEARVDLAQAQLAQAEESLAGAELRAPFDGTVLDILSTPGAILSPGLPVILMGDPSALEVRASVIEEDLPLIEAGQTAELFFDALPEVMTAGVLSRIVPRRIDVERPLYHILITLDAIPEGLVPGMTSDVSVLLDQRAEVLTLPRALVRANSDGFAIVRVWVGDHSEDRTVKVGMRGDVRVEIVDGLKEGEQVVAE